MVEAKPDELQELSQRFQLPNIHQLRADLTIQQNSPGRGTTGKSEDILYIQGSIMSNLTQTCVRTNDDFDVEMNVNFTSTIRSTTFGSNDPDSLIMEEEESNSRRQGDNDRKSSQKKRRKDKKAMSRSSNRGINEIGMMELQNLVTDMSNEDEDNELIEDEAVYHNGVLDAGELVAQIFSLKLDTYPKKPGSKPVKYSITG